VIYMYVYVFLVYRCMSTVPLLPRERRKGGDEAGLRCSSLAWLLSSRETLGGYADGGGAEIN
jgi:hypothetical protein